MRLLLIILILVGCITDSKIFNLQSRVQELEGMLREIIEMIYNRESINVEWIEQLLNK